MSSTEDRLRDNTGHLEERLGAALAANHRQPTTDLGTLEPMPLDERPWHDGTTVPETPTEPAVWVRTEGIWYRAENLDAVPELGATATAVDEWINEQITAGKLRDPRPPQYRLVAPDLVVDDPPPSPNRDDVRVVSLERSRRIGEALENAVQAVRDGETTLQEVIHSITAGVQLATDPLQRAEPEPTAAQLAWFDYRKDSEPSAAQMTASHKAFVAGFEAASARRVLGDRETVVLRVARTLTQIRPTMTLRRQAEAVADALLDGKADR